MKLARREKSETWEAWHVAPPPVEENRVDKRVAAEQSGAYLVREKVVDHRRGEIYFLVSPTDPGAKDQVLRVKVTNDPSIDKGGIVKTLSSSEGKVITANLMQREGSKDWEMYAASAPEVDKKARIVRRRIPEGKEGAGKVAEAFEWSVNLDKQVDKYMAYESYAHTAAIASIYMEAPGAIGDLKAKASHVYLESFMASAQALGMPATEADAESLWAASAGHPASMSSVLEGNQQTSDGKNQQMYYDTETRFAAQLAEATPTKEALASAAMNYAYQKSFAAGIVEMATKNVETKDGRSISPYEAEQERMVAEKTLFDKNPLLDSREMSAECKELAEMNAGKIVRNLMAVSCATPAPGLLDDVRYQGPDAVAETFQAQVRANAEMDGKIPSTAELLKDPSKRAGAQSAILRESVTQSTEQKRVIVESKDGIKHEQDTNGAIRPPFTRVDSGLSQDAKDKIDQLKDMGHQAASKGIGHAMDFMNEIEQGPTIF